MGPILHCVEKWIISAFARVSKNDVNFKSSITCIYLFIYLSSWGEDSIFFDENFLY